MSLFHSPGLTLSGHAWELPVQQARDQADTKAAPTPTTVGQVLRFLQTERPGNLGMLLSLTVDCENARYVFSGKLENLCVLRAGIELQKAGVDPFVARWFSYDSDWSRDG